MLFFPIDSETRILSFAPTAGPVGTELRIFGTGLGGGTGAAVGGVPLTGFTVISDGEVRGIIAAGTTGGPVTVGSATGPVDFVITTGSSGSYTDEQAQDAAAAALVAGQHSGIEFIYGATQDAANRIDARLLLPSPGLFYWSGTALQPLAIGAGLVILGGQLRLAQGDTNVPYSAVSLLLPMDGSNNGTLFPDLSLNDLSLSGSGVITSTAQFKWGSASAFFDGSSSQINLPSATPLDMGAGNFTLECWIYALALGVERNIFKPAGSSANGLSVNSAGRLVWWLDGVGAVLTGSTVIALNTWYYVAIKRSGTTLTLHVAQDGNASTIVDAMTSNSTAWNFSNWRIGSGTFNGSWSGYIDDFRITQGYARDVSVTPVAAFPTS